jgi:hypothetical protein
MVTTNTAIERSPATGASGPSLLEALVVGIEDDRARVRLTAGASAGESAARVAVPGYAPAEGDRVLVQPSDAGGLYVIGVIHAAVKASAELTTPSGATARAEGDAITLRDAAGRLVATFDGASGALAIVAEGDLRLSAPAGKVQIEAAGDVEIAAGGRVAQRAGESEVEIGPCAVAVRSPSLAVNAAAASLAIGHLELRAERIVERTVDAFRTVEGLLETRAKHARTLVARTFELFSRRTTIASEEDTRVDGKRVLLG